MTPFHSSRRRLLAAALGLTLAPSIVGIAPARAADAVPVRVGYIPIVGAAPIFVADKEGLLKAGGLAPRFTTFESGPHMIQALASGTIDVYVAGIAPLAVARTKGIDVKVVAATAIEEMVFVAGPKLAPYFAADAKPADAFKAFKAKEGKNARLGTQPPGSVPDTTLKHWLWKVGAVDKADADIVALGIDATQQAVLAGAIDGATIREPAVSIVTARNPAIKVVALGGAMFPKQPGTVVGVSGAFLAQHPAEVQKLVDAVVKSIAILKSDPDRAVPAVGAALGKGLVDDAIVKAALTSPATKFEADPRIIAGPTAEMQSFQVSIGTLDKNVPLDGLIDSSFYEKAAR